MLAREVPGSARSDRLLAVWAKALVAWVAALPNPRLVRAELALATSLRLLEDWSAPVMRESLPAAYVPEVVPATGICPKAAASEEAEPLARLVSLWEPSETLPVVGLVLEMVERSSVEGRAP